jgi:predicted DNA-binding helix-hairpin-helix protein
MEEMVRIEQEENNRSRWIKVFVPHKAVPGSNASIQDRQGVVLKRLSLNAGYNAIDISQIAEDTINIKIETPYETILKEIKRP